jgi:hypothetical protein
MNVYSYDPITGEYLGATTADSDPLSPGEYLLPAFSTDVQPPVPAEGHRAIWQSGVWTEVPVEFIAPQDEPLTLEAAKEIKLKAIQAERDGLLYGSFYFLIPSLIAQGQNAVPVDADPQSQANILLAAQLAQLPGAPATVDWRMADNATYALTASDVLSMAANLGEHVRSVYARSWERKAALATAQSIEEVASV